MRDVSNIRPWFAEDLRLILMAIYFAMKVAGWRMNAEQWRGVVDALTALGKAWGVKPESFLSEADARRVGG
ncbi:MAG: hypothetical protein HUU11_16450 [Anaerolineales bacterium]|nr:hypothetical protein [Anaerolineales bacterium]